MRSCQPRESANAISVSMRRVWARRQRRYECGHQYPSKGRIGPDRLWRFAVRRVGEAGNSACRMSDTWKNPRPLGRGVGQIGTARGDYRSRSRLCSGERGAWHGRRRAFRRSAYASLACVSSVAVVLPRVVVAAWSPLYY